MLLFIFLFGIMCCLAFILKIKMVVLHCKELKQLYSIEACTELQDSEFLRTR